MAYPAINSLIQTLELFKRTYPSLIHDQTAEMIDSLHASAEYFQNILEKTSHQKHEYKKIKDLEGEIRVALQQAEDLLESNILEIMRERSSQQEEKNNGSKWTIHDGARVLLRDLPQAIDKIDVVRKDLTQECSTSTNANAHSTGAAKDHFFKTGDCSSPKCASTALLRDITLMEKAYRALKGWKYLVVVDDIWSTNIWDLIARTLPDDKIGSHESWKLLCNKLYGVEQHSPLELEEIEKKIVGKWQGLPLAILVVAGNLSKFPMIKESWEIVAKNVSKVVTSYPDQCLAILAMSYHHLPIHLKPCFLHMGTFPEDFVIDTWRLIRHWVAEGFLKSDRLKSPEKVAEDCLEDLISREW
ncbi:hypothetical protein RND71_001319 [Anisodus tanguticus]|uniref:NB-ARC domain-containing protein n=1 Tax=Anisodus tanguticus TaxID=243964 RepID=A0AAE1T297_9SOLA|nr:hypothetical protein RND71_001319 [Anisodus tanguticus]